MADRIALGIIGCGFFAQIICMPGPISRSRASRSRRFATSILPRRRRRRRSMARRVSTPTPRRCSPSRTSACSTSSHKWTPTVGWSNWRCGAACRPSSRNRSAATLPIAWRWSRRRRRPASFSRCMRISGFRRRCARRSRFALGRDRRALVGEDQLSHRLRHLQGPALSAGGGALRHSRSWHHILDLARVFLGEAEPVRRRRRSAIRALAAKTPRPYWSSIATAACRWLNAPMRRAASPIFSRKR